MKRGRPKKMSQDTTLKQLGISRDHASKWQRLADIPEDEFEHLLKNPKGRKPSTEGILREAGKTKRGKTRKTCPHCGGEL